MLVILLVVVWLAALIPMALRKRSDWAFSASMARFRQANRLLSATSAPCRSRYGSPSGPATPPAPEPGAADEAAARRRVVAQRRVERARAQRLRARRRSVLTWLVASLLGSALLGAFPALRALWDLSLVALFATGAYVALLVRLARSEQRVTTPAVRLPAPSPPTTLSPALLPPDRGGVVVPLRPVRPAFVIVEATS